MNRTLAPIIIRFYCIHVAFAPIIIWFYMYCIHVAILFTTLTANLSTRIMNAILRNHAHTGKVVKVLVGQQDNVIVSVASDMLVQVCVCVCVCV